MPRKPPDPGHILYALGALMATHRRAAGLTQHELAAVVGIGYSTLQSYEHGLRAPPYDILIAIAQACDLPLSKFMSGLDDFAVPVREPREVHVRVRHGR